MKKKRSIRKVIIVCFWLCIAAGTMVLLVAAMKVQNNKTCKGYAISLKGKADQWFLDKKDVAALLIVQGGIQGRAIKNFDLRRMENQLKSNVWVKDAELFFDNSHILQVRIEERVPVARLFTVTGNSFYIDSSGERLPLSDKFSAHLPVFTGFPSERDKLNGADSALVRDIINISDYLSHDTFWMAQVSQTDIQPDRTFEMIPVVGNHIIQFGDGSDYEKKFKRLLLFYQQVLSKTGMDVYQKLNVQYARQVIGVKRES
jgi:cell division protein FtsQ